MTGRYTPIQTVDVPAFTLIVAHPSEVRALARANRCGAWERALGFCHVGDRLVVVARDGGCGRLPRQDVLGHEVMHLVYGDYHGRGGRGGAVWIGG